MRLLGLALTVLLVAAWSAVSGPGPGPAWAEENLSEPVNGEIVFPRDHCFHANGTEWVYFSGVVTTDQGKSYGVMFTIFQLTGMGGGFTYPSLLGIGDLEASEFHDAQVISRQGTVAVSPQGLPVIQAGESRFVWERPESLRISSAMSTLDSRELFLELDLTPTREPLLHGGDGFIAMADGNPSGYYSLTNLAVSAGTLGLDGGQEKIAGGRIWMDHQWGDWTSEAYSWDWFSLRFESGGALMLYQFRDAGDEVSGGNWTYRDKDGQVSHGSDFTVAAKRRHESFPLDWTITIPGLQADLAVSPLFDDQGFFALWEGLCRVSGRVGPEEVGGQAFVELAGYSPR